MSEETNIEMEAVAETSASFRDFYPVKEPFGYVGIEIDEINGKPKYVLVEPTLNESELEILEEIKNDLTERMDRKIFEYWKTDGKLDMYTRLNEEAKKILETHKVAELSDNVERIIEEIFKEKSKG